MLSARILPIIANMDIRALCIIIFFTFSSVFASAEEAQSETTETAASGAQPSLPERPRTQPDPNIARISDLLKIQDPITDVLQLDTGKENEKLIAFYRTQGSGITHGGIILFPDTETHTDWPDGLSELRKGLSDYGWHTLSVFLPFEERPAVPKRTLPVLSAIKPAQSSTESGEDANTEQEATEPPEGNTPQPPTESPEATNQSETADNKNDAPDNEPYETLIFRLGNTAYNYLQSTAGAERIIVLGIGSGAVWAAKYVEQHQDQQDLRLVMIDAQPPIDNEAPKLADFLPNIKVTIIDLHYSPQFNSLKNAANDLPGQRLRLARQKRMNNFHQSRLPAQPDDWKSDNPRLLKHTRGLINTYIIKAEREQRNIQVPNAQQENEKAPG